ncbi:MAG: methyltransferase [Bryobacteraceae bacterium]
MLQRLNAEEGRELRGFFRESGYTSDALQDRFSAAGMRQLDLLKLYLLGLPLEPSRLTTLFRWFWIGAPVATVTAEELIPERMLSLFLKAGLLTLQEGSLVSTARVSPFAEYLILSDHAVSRAGTLSPDTVLWPTPATLLCYHLSIQTPVGRTLDLGTGNGVLALMAASHSASVVATDLNFRAGEFCAFNAALNGVTNVEFRGGSAFEPVRGERFDLILANPPFFVTPSVRRTYSDNSMELDGFCRKLILEAPEHLNENGYCQMLIEWVQVHGQPWQDRLKEWFEGLGCDAWVLVNYRKSAAEYALLRIQDDRDEVPMPEAQAALAEQWQAYFESHQAQAIYGGIVVLHKRKGRNWIRMEELPHPKRPFGEFLRHTFANRDVLESLAGDEQLLATRPALPASARLQEQFAISREGWKLTSVELQLGDGLPYSLALQPRVAHFIALLDGGKTLAEVADQFAVVQSADPALVRRECCAIIKQLADRGLIHL